MYQRARIGGYCHLNLGEEATCAGLCAGMQPGDYLFTNYREHGYALARGMDPGRIMAELGLDGRTPSEGEIGGFRFDRAALVDPATPATFVI